jgi:uncharacterized GH25 family protein
MKRSAFFLTAALVFPWLTSLAGAHYLWIERDAGSSSAKVFFGEVAEDVKEKSGGRLDTFNAISASASDGKSASIRKLSVTKMDDHFLIAKAPSRSALLVRDEQVEVADLTKHGIGVVKPFFYARAGSADGAKPVHTLDIVPLSTSSGTFRVFFRGAPLPDAKVMIYAPNRWMQEHKTDKDGTVTVSMPWPGQYVLDVTHKEETKDQFKGKPYEAMRHRATYTVVTESK